MRVQNINTGTANDSVKPEKYWLIRDAILRELPSTQAGIPWTELCDRVAPHVPIEMRPAPGSVRWLVKTVQLDLEARGLIERIPGVTPQHLRKVKGARDASPPPKLPTRRQ